MNCETNNPSPGASALTVLLRAAERSISASAFLRKLHAFRHEFQQLIPKYLVLLYYTTG